MKIQLIPGGKAPERMTSGAVGYDCYAREVELHQDEYSYHPPHGAAIRLGFKVDCSDPFEVTRFINEHVTDFKPSIVYGAFLFPRSGWARKYGFKLKNTIGVIDPDYRGEVIAEVEFDECPPELLAYDADSKLGITKDQPRVCQMVFLPCYVGELMQVDKLDDTERGDGGFGSTDKGV